jgi:hypothetical protein
LLVARQAMQCSTPLKGHFGGLLFLTYRKKYLLYLKKTIIILSTTIHHNKKRKKLMLESGVIFYIFTAIILCALWTLFFITRYRCLSLQPYLTRMLVKEKRASVATAIDIQLAVDTFRSTYSIEADNFILVLSRRGFVTHKDIKTIKKYFPYMLTAPILSFIHENSPIPFSKFVSLIQATTIRSF